MYTESKENRKRVIGAQHYQQTLLVASFVLLGLGWHLAYASLIAVYFYLIKADLTNAKLQKNYLVLLLLISLFFIPHYTLGYEQSTLDHPLLSMLSVYFCLLVMGYAYQAQSQSMQTKLFVALVIGIGLEALIIVGYSLYLDPELYGRRRLFNPMRGTEINSPSSANKLALLASLCIYVLLSSKNKLLLLMSLIGLSGLCAIAGWLGGRAFFVIVVLAFVLAILMHFNWKKLLYLSLIVVLMLASWDYLVQWLSLDQLTVYERFGRGLNSPRFALYADGWHKLLDHPFGGFAVDRSIDSVSWFHNIFIDAGRLGGWLPILGLLAFVAYTGIKLIRNANVHSLFAAFIFAVVFVLAQQDVIVEVMVRMVFVLFFAAVLITNNSDKTVNVHA